mgnify:CR=1 FL=1
MLGIGFIDDLISDVGLPLVKKGIKALTGIDIEAKELTAEDKQKIMDAQIEIMKIDFEKLKLEKESNLESTRLGLQETKQFLDDKSNARTREVEVTKATGKRDYSVTVLAGIIVFGFFAGLVSLIFMQLDKGSGTYELLYMMFGALIAKFGTVIDYFFGSSNKVD